VTLQISSILKFRISLEGWVLLKLMPQMQLLQKGCPCISKALILSFLEFLLYFLLSGSSQYREWTVLGAFSRLTNQAIDVLSVSSLHYRLTIVHHLRSSLNYNTPLILIVWFYTRLSVLQILFFWLWGMWLILNNMQFCFKPGWFQLIRLICCLYLLLTKSLIICTYI